MITYLRGWPVSLLLVTLMVRLAAVEPINAGADSYSLDLGNVPPSPSTVSGERIYQDPSFTHWPPLMYVDERRNIAFGLEARPGEHSGAINWMGSEPMPLKLVSPLGGNRFSGLLDLPQELGTHTASVRVGKRTHRIQVRVVDIGADWPHSHLRDGFPVTEEDVPVVIRSPRLQRSTEQRFQLLRGDAERPEGAPLLIGDPLPSLGDDCWPEPQGRFRTLSARHERRSWHAVVVALAAVEPPYPSTVMVCLGNEELLAGTWTPEEERLLALVRLRFQALGAAPRLVLAVPPLPVDQDVQERGRERRDLLIRSATFGGWEVLDLGRITDNDAQAMALAENLYARYPIGEARQAIKRAIAETLLR